MVPATVSQVSEGARKPFQFSTAGLLCLMAFVAISMVLVPLACQVSLEIVCLAALILCTVTLICDFAPRFTNWYLRSLLSVLLAVVTMGMIAHIPRILQGTTSTVPAAPMILATFLAIFRVTLARFGRFRLSFSTLGFTAISGLLIWQIVQTRAQCYFVNRYITSWETAQALERDGAVSYQLRTQSRGGSRRSPLEIDTLFDSLDSNSLFRPVTKCRLICGSDAVSSLSFHYATTALDWENLQRLTELEYLDFTSLRISTENAQFVNSLRKLRQLACFGCELPSGFLENFRDVDQLTILQIVDCKPVDLDGIVLMRNLRTLNLRKTKLGRSDLSQLASLQLLSNLNLQDTQIGSADLIFFADCLTKSSALRRGSFKCTVTCSNEYVEGLAALIRSGSINELALAQCEMSELDLAALRAIDPKVTLTVLASDD